MHMKRRTFMKEMAAAASVAGAVFLLPSLTSCSSDGSRTVAGDPLALPKVKPARWNAVAYNKDRAFAGGAPATYHSAIAGPDGDKKHVGKHLPYLPTFDKTPDGYLAVMFGDESKGYARHPNSAAVPELDDAGHWYDWIEIRKATEGQAKVVKSSYSSWPLNAQGDNGQLASFTGKDLSDNKGRDTVYLAALPSDVKPGDTIRVTGHCKMHGDWTDFFTI